MARKNSLFDTGKPNKRLAKAISIKSPNAFRKSINKLAENGLTTKEKRSLVLAQNRAKAQLGRKDLSKKEKKQFKKIKDIDIGLTAKR